MADTNTAPVETTTSTDQKETANPLLKTRLLNVQIVRAEKLAKLVKDETNAYATISLLDLAGRIVKGESFKTTTKNNDNSPVWDEKFTFGKPSSNS